MRRMRFPALRTLALACALASSAALLDGPPPAWFLEGYEGGAGADGAGAADSAGVRGASSSSSSRSSHARDLLQGGAAAAAAAAGGAGGTSGARCGPLTKELVASVARDNTVLLTALDKLVWKAFGPSFVENVVAANISYYLVAALDPATSLALGAAGAAAHCFNAPPDRLKYKGADSAYAWGGHHWTQTTWNKVHMVHAAYELGVHVVHSDADVVWFSDPLPYFHAQLSGPAHIIIATDSVATGNTVGDTGLEAHTTSYVNINTGVYFIRQWPGGRAFFDVWLSWQDKNIGHDQDGFNTVARGAHFHGDPALPGAPLPANMSSRIFYAALSNTTAISFLPASSFANTYTYVNARLWEKMQIPLYEVHWVWGGSTQESKRQNMRDAMKFHDEPDYYTAPHVVSFDLDQMFMPDEFNTWKSTEEMMRFHVQAANHQLQQVYYAMAVALITNRTLVLPKFLCYCSKNWYQLQSCRINGESASTFPFACALSHLMRAKRLQQGFSLPESTQYSGHRVAVREHSFLKNPKVPAEFKKAYIEIVPSDQPRPASLPPGSPTAQLILSTVPAPNRPEGGWRVTVASPLNDQELAAVAAQFSSARVLHLPRPQRVLSGFVREPTAALFDAEIQKRVTYWCCRSPPDMQSMNLTDRVQLVALPPHRFRSLPSLRGSSYLHELGPIPRMPGQTG